ncbi:MAG TPA: nuclear transport factor 2 family protein [Steroidobacteraceae bacterium]|nr:nuclear transport factor 2 family protein [Steroidobacteraceae bacterium]
MTDFVVAENAIRQLHARYVDAVWRKDYPAFGDCFAQDAEWRIAGMVIRGRPQIEAALQRFMQRFHRVLMTFRTPIIEVGNGTAVGRTYVTEQSALLNGRPGATIGIYYERFVDEGDRWRFSWRLFQLHYMGPADLSGSFFEQADYGAPPAMPDLDAPTINYSGLGAG